MLIANDPTTPVIGLSPYSNLGPLAYTRRIAMPNILHPNGSMPLQGLVSKRHYQTEIRT